MTTQVIIKSPKPNHKDVIVMTVRMSDGEIIAEKRLCEDQEVMLYVFDGQILQIAEIEKMSIE